MNEFVGIAREKLNVAARLRTEAANRISINDNEQSRRDMRDARVDLESSCFDFVYAKIIERDPKVGSSLMELFADLLKEVQCGG